MADLHDKRVLLIGPPNNNYPQTVKQEIERVGGKVHFYDERNNPNTLEKIILRKAPQLMNKRMEKYYYEIMVKEKSFNPDYVLFISPESVTERIVRALRKRFKHAKFILYMWDSIENKNAKEIYKIFDKCLSFDKNDCDKYGFVFRPLFFSWEYNTESVKNIDYKYDFGFIGTAHSDRAKILYRVEQHCKDNDLKYFFYIYVQGSFMLAVRMLQDRYIRSFYKEGLVHTKTMARDKVEKTMEGTRYVIDVNHPKQTGLTMRTIEMLGLRRKLLTTNEHIKDYDFYNPVNQIVIDRNSVEIDKNVIDQPYQVIDQNIYLKYRVDHWVQDVFAEI